MKSSAVEWLQDGKLGLEHLAAIHSVFAAANSDGQYDELLDEVEGYFLKNATHMPAGLAARMISTCAAAIRDPEVVEVCEKLVAHGLNEMYLQERGAETVYQVYTGFMTSQHARPKIIELLLARITENIAKLPTEA